METVSRSMKDRLAQRYVSDLLLTLQRGSSDPRFTGSSRLPLDLN